ncbi:hypothetical protein [Chitinimonas sp.]|uniref:hypothetical protein n=1 Tax=Chitinimonas sp. TaxID=1934313 RepID=UPI0035B4D0FE
MQLKPRLRASGYILAGFSLCAAIVGAMFAAEISETDISACAKNDQAELVLLSTAYFVLAICLGYLATSRIRLKLALPRLEPVVRYGIVSASSTAATIAFIEHYIPALIFTPLATGLVSIYIAAFDSSEKANIAIEIQSPEA